ncbi:MAG: hypothetical protein Q9M36_12615 [Sulfurovum sp.]|nr:hypothetical protein [Sulfurovum sp.]
MLNLSLVCDGKMLVIPQEYYEQGTSEKSKAFFIQSYQAMEAQAMEIGYGKA